MMKSVYDFQYEEWVEFVHEKGWKPFRAKQIFQWLYRRRVTSFDEMTDLKQEVCEVLAEQFYFDTMTLIEKQVSKDGTIKFLFALKDQSMIECVLMIYDYGKTICVTSQVGCNMGCTFCASGLLKKTRDLSSGEMTAQVLEVQRHLDKTEARVSHVVVMGIGEPFDNYTQVMRFCRIVNHDLGLAIGGRHITISTCGLAPMIRQFADEQVQFNLAISLHAPNNELRSQLMPINNAYPLEDLFDAIHYYASKSNRKITFEYILLKGINDQKECAKQLMNLLKDLNAYINLIPYNNIDLTDYKSVDYKSALVFYDLLMKYHVKCTIRQKQGDDIEAACGQLRANYERKRHR